MDEKCDETLNAAESEAILDSAAGIGNADTDSFSATAADDLDSYKAFISSPSAETDALVETLISDATGTSKEVTTNDDFIQESQELSSSEASKILPETSTSTLETVASISEEGIITTSSEILQKQEDTESTTETSAVINDQSESKKDECNETSVQPKDVLSRAVEAMDTDLLSTSTADGGEVESKTLQNTESTSSADDTLTLSSQQSEIEPIGADNKQQDMQTDQDDAVPVLGMSDATANMSTATANMSTATDNLHKDSLCDLEEELKRMHEGDDTPEPIIESNLSLHPAVVVSSPQPANQLQQKSVNGQATPKSSIETVNKVVNKPIMKDSDLEEMLSADDVLKDADLIQQSQKDLQTTDLLVCGKCHEVFHFIEAFQKHKKSSCHASSKLLSICENESKPQVWGFTLWKNKQYRLVKPGNPLPSSWSIYQKWCKLADSDKKTWIAAGQTLQFCNRIGLAKLTEVKSKSPQKQTVIEKDPLALDGFMDSNKENSSAPTPQKSLRVNKEIAIMPKEKITENTNKALRTVKSTETKEYVVEKITAKRFNPKRKTWEYNIKWENFSSDENTWEPLANLGHCKKMIDQFEDQLKKLKMEKAAKQQAVNMSKNKGKNDGKKDSGSSFSSSTPQSSSRNTSSTGRPQRQCKQKALNQVKAWCGNIDDDDEATSGAAGGGGGVKRSHDEDDSDDSFEKKMKYEEDSEDSEFEPKQPANKMMKKEPITPRGLPVVVKNGIPKGTPLPQNILIPDANGVVRINQKQLPSLSTGVYIMSKTAGIIKLDSTTSKVATSGGQTIVKVAPKIGQTQIKIVKKDGGTTTTTTSTQQVIQVNPKTPGASPTATIKTFSRAASGSSKLGGTSTSNKVAVTTTPTTTKIFKPIITKVKKFAELSVGEENAKKAAKTPEVTTTPKIRLLNSAVSLGLDQSQQDGAAGGAFDESDDGLEELPFPEDIKVPEPDSPPGEFTLDPFTGKIAGVEYPDLPDPEPMDEEPATAAQTEEKKEEMTLDNIVKLAAADITEDDLKGDPSETQQMEIEVPLDGATAQTTTTEDQQQSKDDDDSEKIKTCPLVIRKTDLTPSSVAAMPIKSITRVTVAQSPIKLQQRQSILNQALTTTTAVSNSTTPRTHFIRKTIVTPGSQHRMQQQRILNPTVIGSGGNRTSTSTTVLNPILRVPPSGGGGIIYSRTKPLAPRPKFNIAGSGGGAGGGGTTGNLVAAKVLRSPAVVAQQQQQQQMLAAKNVYTTYTTKVAQQPVMSRKIGHTTIRSSPSSTTHSPKQHTRIIQSVGAGGNTTTTTTTVVGGTKFVQRSKDQSVLLRGHPERRSMHHQQLKPKPKTVISMPSLIGDEDSMSPLSIGETVAVASPAKVMQQQHQTNIVKEAQQHAEIHMPVIETTEAQQVVISSAPTTVIDPVITAPAAAAATTTSSGESSTTTNTSASQQAAQDQMNALTDMSSFTLADSENPIYITGDDGTVYQVAGQNEQGQTILLTQDANGQQQCLLVTNELAENVDTPAEEQQQQTVQVAAAAATTATATTTATSVNAAANISMPEITTDVTVPLQVKTATEEDTSDQVVAQVVRAEPPSPGGTHKVVVMLPDGNLMVTQVSPEEYASLELD